MAIIRDIRRLKGAAVLAERKAATPSLDLKRFNLFYGFNGSGKSTLSRMFAALQHGRPQDRLPDGCTFEIEMSDGTRFSYPNSLSGVEKRVCVFNSDFVAENLLWETGVANPVFYIGAGQAEAAERLRALEAKLPAAKLKHEGEEKVLKERQRAFNEYKRLLARSISERLRQPGRYEAPQLVADMEKFGDSSVRMTAAELDAATAASARSEAPAKVAPVEVPISALLEVIDAALTLAPMSIGSIVVDSLDAHPQMVPWIKHGHDYHVTHSLKSCLYCGETISEERRELLSSAFDGRFSKFVTDLDNASHRGGDCLEALAIAGAAVPTAAQLSAEFQPAFKIAASKFTAAVDHANHIVTASFKALRERQLAPTKPVKLSLPSTAEISGRIKALELSRDAINAICKRHADMVDDFREHQKRAREAIRSHFVATNAGDYNEHVSGISNGEKFATVASLEVEELERDIATLRQKVQQHEPAADKINALVKSYLGHDELMIVAVADGYELHRHGSLVAGAPSEGEKTAVALCYFLSTLEADDRRLQDLIVVIDDPVSSLDTKAMNYACGLIRNRLSDTAQLIVLTHNQHCMNEFKKFWKGWAKSGAAMASLKFIDVSIPAGAKTRTSSILDLPKHLREYESEYHYLFEKVMACEAAGSGHFDYAFMMPNVLRRVLEVFMAFKVPRSGNLSDKLKTLCGRHKDLDQDRLSALERLSQVESHSDNLDDLIAQSSMTIEEGRDANAALIHLMKVVDPAHLEDLRSYCKV